MSSSISTNTRYRVPNDYAQAYLARKEDLRVESSTTETYDGILNEFVHWLHDRDIGVLGATCDDVRNYIETCVSRGNRESTLSSKLSVIDNFYRYIYVDEGERHRLSLDPLLLTKIDVSEYNTPPKIQRKALNREEIRRLFDAFGSYRNRLMCIVAVETGGRNSDIRNLRIQDIYSDHIHIHDPKGGRPYDVPISDDLHFEIDYWLSNVRSGYTYAADSPYVFLSRSGVKLQSNSSFNSIVKQAAERAGLLDKPLGRSELPEQYVEAHGLSQSYRVWSRVTPHVLRHSYITLLKESDVPITYRMLVSNHRNAETNLTYTHGGNDVIDYIRGSFNPPR